MSIFTVINLLGGLALFMYGMRIMGDGLKTGNSGTMQKVLGGVTNSAFKGFILGVVVTALIQSSTATIVLTAGLVGAGILTLEQSVGIVLGANVGTTITGQIIRLLDLNSSGGADWINFFKPDTLAPLAALLGIILIMFVKSKKSDTVGIICMGFGILFTGLINMTAAVEPLSKSPEFIDFFARFSGKPLLGFLAGTAVSTITQSSSASVGMLQTLSVTGALTFSSIYPILVGIYLGDAITTAIVCSIGTRADAKRTGLITVLFSIFSIFFIMIGVWALRATGVLNELWLKRMTSGTIANANTLFKLAAALVCVPLSKLFYRISLRLVKDETTSTDIIFDAAAQKLDTKLFLSPKMALASAHEVIKVMQRLATDNARRAAGLLKEYSEEEAALLNKNEDLIDRMADAVDDYLIQFAAHVDSNAASDILNYYLQCYSEMERIGDHAMNLAENAEALTQRSHKLSEDSLHELDVLFAAIGEILEYAAESFAYFDTEVAAKIEPLEEVIDDLVAEAKKRHIQRLREGRCSSTTGMVYVDVLTNIERISDQCSNIAVSTLALSDASIMHNRHEYIHKLHEGGNAAYNSEYSRQRAVYMGDLGSMEDK